MKTRNLKKRKYEELAKKLHEWYLEAIKELSPESFNPDAQKPYSELTEEQRFIDLYIAKKIVSENENKISKSERQ